MTAREDIAAAVTGTGLVNVTPYYRQSLKPGDGFVRWAGATQDTRFASAQVSAFEVWVALPQDLKAAEQWIDANLPALMTALAGELVVTGATPNELVVGNGPGIPGIVLAGTRGAGQ